jgi:hypothetical protein
MLDSNVAPLEESLLSALELEFHLSLNDDTKVDRQNATP